MMKLRTLPRRCFGVKARKRGRLVPGLEQFEDRTVPAGWFSLSGTALTIIGGQLGASGDAITLSVPVASSSTFTDNGQSTTFPQGSVQSVQVNLVPGTNSVTIQDNSVSVAVAVPTVPAGGNTIEVDHNAGQVTIDDNGAGDTINIFGNAAGGTINVPLHLTNGVDQVNIGQAGSTAGVLGNINVDGAHKNVVVDDSADTQASAWSIGDTGPVLSAPYGIKNSTTGLQVEIQNNTISVAGITLDAGLTSSVQPSGNGDLYPFQVNTGTQLIQPATWTVNGTTSGNTGTTLIGPTGTEQLNWAITGPNQGTLAWSLVDDLIPDKLSFNGMANLQGGNGGGGAFVTNNYFTIALAGQLSGNLTGGDGFTTLDYTAWQTANQAFFVDEVGGKATAIAGKALQVNIVVPDQLLPNNPGNIVAPVGTVVDIPFVQPAGSTFNVLSTPPAGLNVGTDVSGQLAVFGTGTEADISAATLPAGTVPVTDGAGSYRYAVSYPVTMQMFDDLGNSRVFSFSITVTHAYNLQLVPMSASAPVNAVYATPFQAIVTDEQGTGVPGLFASFSVVPGASGAGGQFRGATGGGVGNPNGGQAPTNVAFATTDTTGTATVGGHFPVNYFTANGQAGTFAVAAALRPQYSPTLTGQIALANLAPNMVAVFAPDAVYNGQPYQRASASVAGSGGTILVNPNLTFTYFAQGNPTPLAGAPVDAGSYQMVVNFAGDGTNAPSTGSATFAITPRPITVHVGNLAKRVGQDIDLAQLLASSSGTTVTGPGNQPLSISFNTGATETTAVSTQVDNAASGVKNETVQLVYSSAGAAAGADVDIYLITAKLADGTGKAADYVATVQPGNLFVLPLPPATTTTLQAPTQTSFGQECTFTAIVQGPPMINGDPHDLVDFFDGTTLLGKAGVAVVNGLGQTTFTTTTPLGVGSHSITAMFEGDTFLNASTSAPASLVVMPQPPKMIAIAESGPNARQDIDAFGALNGDDASVVFTNLGVNLPGDGFSNQLGQIASGLTDISIAVPQGESSFTLSPEFTLGMTKTANSDVTFSLPQITASPPSGMTVSVLAPPSSTFPFPKGLTIDNPLFTFAPAPVVVRVSSDSPGAILHVVIKAAVSGNRANVHENVIAFVDGIDVKLATTTPATTTTLQAPGRTRFGQESTFTATVQGSPTMSGFPNDVVDFFDGTNHLGTASVTVVDGMGQATFTTTTPLDLGSHSITAMFEGDTFLDPSTSAASSLDVEEPIAPPVSAPSMFDAFLSGPGVMQDVDAFAAFNGPDNLSVVFTNLGVNLPADGFSSELAQTTSGLTDISIAVPPGASMFTLSPVYTFGITKSANADATLSFPQVTYAVRPPSGMTVSVLAPPSSTNDVPSGVTIDQPLGTFTPAPVVVRVSSSSPGAVLHIFINAVVTGDRANDRENVIAFVDGIDVKLATATPDTTTTLQVPTQTLFGQESTFTATVQASSMIGGNPNDLVDFFDGPTPLGQAVVSVVNGLGLATFTTTTPLGVGSHSITAVFDGDTFLDASTSAASTLTVAPITSANLQQAIVAALQTGTPLAIQATPAQMQDIQTAFNGLSAPAAPITVTVNLSAGTAAGLQFTLPKNLTLVIRGTAGATTFRGGSPALTLTSGSLEIDNVLFTDATNTPTILVHAGSLTLRGDTVEETSAGDQAAIAITGGSVDLGTSAQPGGNTFDINGHGRFIANTGPAAVPTIGDTFEQNGTTVTDPYRIARDMLDAVDGGGGLVTFVAGNIYVNRRSGNIQHAVDAAAAGTVIHVQAGGDYRNYTVGTKILTIAFQNGPTLRLADDSALATHSTTLRVTGSPQDGTDVDFRPGRQAGTVDVAVDDWPVGTFAPTGGFVAHGGGGRHANIQVSSRLTLPALLFADAPGAHLHGGGGSTLEVGAGDGVLEGGDGRNVLIAGHGSGVLVGGRADDVLIAGTTDFDANEAALVSILQSWAASESVGGTYPLTAATVHDNGAANVLDGGGGVDLYFAALVKRNVRKDPGKVVAIH